MTEIELIRFFKKITKTSSCWIWVGSRNHLIGGYGIFWINHKRIYAHRASYLHFKGEIEQGKELDHLCRNRPCVNPDHLEAVTRSVNTLRGLVPILARQRGLAVTHCKNGHEYTEENTYRRKDRGTRDCKTCRSIRKQLFESNRKYDILSQTMI